MPLPFVHKVLGHQSSWSTVSLGGWWYFMNQLEEVYWTEFVMLRSGGERGLTPFQWGFQRDRSLYYCNMQSCFHTCLKEDLCTGQPHLRPLWNKSCLSGSLKRIATLTLLSLAEQWLDLLCSSSSHNFASVEGADEGNTAVEGKQVSSTVVALWRVTRRL